MKALDDYWLVVVDALQLPGVGGKVLGPDRSKVDHRPDQATSDTANHGLRLEQISKTEGLEADAAGEHQLRKEVDPCDLHVEPGSLQVALGFADVGSVLK